MLAFNLRTSNRRAFPGIDPFVTRTGEHVRIRVGNLTSPPNNLAPSVASGGRLRAPLNRHVW